MVGQKLKNIMLSVLLWILGIGLIVFTITVSGIIVWRQSKEFAIRASQSYNRVQQARQQKEREYLQYVETHPEEKEKLEQLLLERKRKAYADKIAPEPVREVNYTGQVASGVALGIVSGKIMSGLFR